MKDPVRPGDAAMRRLAHVVAVIGAFAAVTLALTWRVAFHLESVGRADTADGQFGIWNVAWVARALVRNPLHVFDANIFYPNHGTLAYSESNLGAGLLAVPVYWLTRNPYAAYNFVVLASFVLSATCMYFLVCYLTADRRAAAIAAICFAYSPYAFAHTAQVQLLMTAGLPLAMLAFHRLADAPSPWRGVALGAALALQALFCGYYAVFAGLMVGFAIIVIAAVGRRWRDRMFWAAVGMAAITAFVLIAPLFAPYRALQHATGFSRTLDFSRGFSADWRAYLASPAYAHEWMRRALGHWQEVLFPGFVALTCAAIALAAARTGSTRTRTVIALYSAIAVLAAVASLGPAAGVYSVLYHAVPVFSLLRAPARFGVVVVCAMSVLAGLGVVVILERVRRPTLTAALVGAAAVAELAAPFAFVPVPPTETAYRVLANLPYGAVLELPVFSSSNAFIRARYMLSSTIHWRPIVDAYSDYTPEPFAQDAAILGGFPSAPAIAIARSEGVRYAVFHMDGFAPAVRADIVARLEEFRGDLVRCYADDRISIYGILPGSTDGNSAALRRTETSGQH